MTTAAVNADDLTIPLINFSHFLEGDAAQKKATATAILEGFQKAGFIYLTDHGIPRTTINATFAASAEFFRRPLQEKQSLAWTTPEANRGYTCLGREKTTDLTDASDIAAIRAAEGADLKESFEIGREGAMGLPNRWPEEGERGEGVEFRRRMTKFHDLVKQLHIQIMQAIAVGLGIDEHWFDSYCDGGDNTLRLLHYPEVSHQVFKDNSLQVRAGAHTDYGSITCLFQDMAGGLQVLSPKGTYVNATPIEDAIVVNAGDLLARWSNDTIKSTKHRVVEPPSQADFHPARYSIAYFCNPNFNRFIESIPGTWSEEKPKKYPGVNSGDYLVQRLTATY